MPWCMRAGTDPFRFGQEAQLVAEAMQDWIEEWFGTCLKAVGLKAEQGSVWGDEMRMGLCGPVCKVWGAAGAVFREVQIGRKYTYVAVALDPMTGRLWW